MLTKIVGYDMMLSRIPMDFVGIIKSIAKGEA